MREREREKKVEKQREIDKDRKREAGVVSLSTIYYVVFIYINDIYFLFFL